MSTNDQTKKAKNRPNTHITLHSYQTGQQKCRSIIKRPHGQKLDMSVYWRKASPIKCHTSGRCLKEKSNFILHRTIRGMFCTTIPKKTVTIYRQTGWREILDYPGGSWSSGKQYSHVIQERHWPGITRTCLRAPQAHVRHVFCRPSRPRRRWQISDLCLRKHHLAYAQDHHFGRHVV